MRKKWLWVLFGSVALSMAAVIWGLNKPSRWEQIGASPSLTYYVDRSSILKSGDHATIWLLADNKAAQELDGKSYTSSKQQFEIDCKEAKKSLLRYTLYAGSMGQGGEVTSNSLSSHEWSSATPGSVAETMWELSCHRPWWKFWNYSVVAK